MIEKVILLKTLKAGQEIWEEGRILDTPIPPDILNEIYLNTGTVEIIQGDRRSSTKMVFVTERVKESASSMTTMATKPSPIVQNKPKPKLIRRKR